MDLHAEITYPGTSAQETFALAVDPAFRARVCEETNAIDHDVSVDQYDDGTASVTISRTLDADVPDFAKKLVGDHISIVQREEWGAATAQGDRTADLVVEVTGQPAKMTGTISLEADGDDAREHITGEVTVSVPF
ncbi:MAG: DUF2505 domain-containing protein, partial [Nocardioidaceae bacterium]